MGDEAKSESKRNKRQWLYIGSALVAFILVAVLYFAGASEETGPGVYFLRFEDSVRFADINLWNYCWGTFQDARADGAILREASYQCSAWEPSYYSNTMGDAASDLGQYLSIDESVFGENEVTAQFVYVTYTVGFGASGVALLGELVNLIWPKRWLVHLVFVVETVAFSFTLLASCVASNIFREALTKSNKGSQTGNLVAKGGTAWMCMTWIATLMLLFIIVVRLLHGRQIKKAEAQPAETPEEEAKKAIVDSLMSPGMRPHHQPFYHPHPFYGYYNPEAKKD